MHKMQRISSICQSRQSSRCNGNEEYNWKYTYILTIEVKILETELEETGRILVI